MSNFLKEHLKLSSVDSSAQSPQPIQHYLGRFMPPGFEHIEGPKRGVNILDMGSRMNKFDRKALEVIGEVDAYPPLIALINR